MMSFIRKAIGQELAFEEGLQKYTDLKSRLPELKSELAFLSWRYATTTDSFQKALSQYPDKKDSYNIRYNIFFSDHIEDIRLVKEESEQIGKALNQLMTATPFLKQYTNMIEQLDEPDYDWVFESYMKDSLDIPRDELPQYTYQTANKLISKLNNEEIISNKISIPVNILKPTQQKINKVKVRNMLENGITDKKFIPLISKDLHILDGHHCWAAHLEEDEDQLTDAVMINLPMDELLRKIQRMEAEQEAATTIIKAAFQQGSITSDEYEEIQNFLKKT